MSVRFALFTFIALAISPLNVVEPTCEAVRCVVTKISAMLNASFQRMALKLLFT
jgi:hypothetical protein